jgi:hypothetical protein
MANKFKRKLVIDSDKLRKAIKDKKTSIRKLGPAIGYSDKTISRGLKDGMISLELAVVIGRHLQVNITDFAVLSTDEEKLFVLFNNFPKEGLKVKSIKHLKDGFTVTLEMPTL